MMIDVLVIGAGPAGVLAAIRAAELGAHTELLTSGELGGMAANDGPVPVRTLAYAARLLGDARQLPRYGIMMGNQPVLEFEQLLARIREVVLDVRGHSALPERIDALGVTVHDRCGPARFVGPNLSSTLASSMRSSGGNGLPTLRPCSRVRTAARRLCPFRRRRWWTSAAEWQKSHSSPAILRSAGVRQRSCRERRR